MTCIIGRFLRLLLRAFGIIAVESEKPIGPPAAIIARHYHDGEPWIAEEGW